MELTTHCPQCATAFLVSEDQLELAQGWVRCGVCQEVFMAQAHTSAPVTQVAPVAVLEEPRLHRQETMAQAENTALAEAPPSAIPESTGAAGVRPQPKPAKTHYRWTSRGALFILLVTLAAQLGADAYRNMADTQPQLALWLQALCPPARCALRQDSVLGIDDSSLTSAGTNGLHLKALIINRSKLTLEAPSLALTLTDAADDILARKVYAPKEWSAQTPVMPGSSTTPVDLWIQWDDTASKVHVAGYRLQAFYP